MNRQLICEMIANDDCNFAGYHQFEKRELTKGELIAALKLAYDAGYKACATDNKLVGEKQ